MIEDKIKPKNEIFTLGTAVVAGFAIFGVYKAAESISKSGGGGHEAHEKPHQSYIGNQYNI